MLSRRKASAPGGMACPYFRVARPPLTYPRKAMAAGCGSSPALLFPPSSFLLVCFGLGHCVRALPRKLLLPLLQRGTEPGRLGPGGRCWRPAVAIRWGSYFRKRVLLGYFFLAWSDSMESVPPVSCWKELWPPAYWEVSGRKWPGMSHIQCGHFCQLSCLLHSTLVLNWTWCPGQTPNVTLSHRKNSQLLAVLGRGSPHCTESRR